MAFGPHDTAILLRWFLVQFISCLRGVKKTSYRPVHPGNVRNVPVNPGGKSEADENRRRRWKKNSNFRNLQIKNYEFAQSYTNTARRKTRGLWDRKVGNALNGRNRMEISNSNESRSGRSTKKKKKNYRRTKRKTEREWEIAYLR